MLTLFSILIPIGSLFFIGLPIATFLTPHKNWIMAPFLGLVVIVLFLQNLMYLGIPIGISFYAIWIGGLILWLIFFKFYSFKKIVPIPFILLIIASLMYLLHSLGLILVGPEYYIGRGWYDQYSYVVNSQLLMEHSLTHLKLNDFLTQPAMMKAYLFINSDRIGENVFEGFIASSLFTDAKTAFEPVILILPFLIVFAIYDIAMRFRFSKKTAFIISIISASLPSVAFIHLESFLSQALTTPILLIWPCILDEVFTQKSWKNILAASLLLAGSISIYTEYSVIFLAIMAVFLLHHKKLKLGFFIIISALVLNPVFIPDLFMIAHRALQGRNWVNIYPFAHSLNGMLWIWLGDFTWTLTGLKKTLFEIFTILCLILAYLGFAIFAYKQRNVFSYSILILVLLPLFIFLNISHHGYQFYKLLISISPLFPIGIVLALTYLVNLKYKKIEMYFAMIVGCFTISATLFSVIVTTEAESLKHVKRGIGYQLLLSDTKEVQKQLQAIQGKNILISWQDNFHHGDFMNGWLSYFARHNKIWLSNHNVGDLKLGGALASLSTLPKEYLLLTHAGNTEFPLATKLWGNQTYAIWQVK